MITKKVEINNCTNSTYSLVKESLKLNKLYIDQTRSSHKNNQDYFQWSNKLKDSFDMNLIQEAEYIKRQEARINNIRKNYFNNSIKTEDVENLSSHPVWFAKLVQIRESYLQYKTSQLYSNHEQESCWDIFWQPLLELFESDLDKICKINNIPLQINTKVYIDFLNRNLSKIFDSLLGEFFDNTKSSFSLSTENSLNNISLEYTLKKQGLNDKITEEITCGFANILSCYPVFGKKLSLIYLNYLNFFSLCVDRLKEDINEILEYNPSSQNIVVNLIPCRSTLGIFHPKCFHVQLFVVSGNDTKLPDDPIEVLYIEKNFTAEKFFSSVYSCKGIDKSSQYILPPSFLPKDNYGYVYLTDKIEIKDQWPYLLYYLGQITYLYWLLDLDKSAYYSFYYFNEQIILVDEVSASLLRPTCIPNRSYNLLYSKIDDLNKVNYKLTAESVLKTGIIQNFKILNGETIDLSLLGQICKNILPKLEKDYSLSVYTKFLQFQKNNQSYENPNNLESLSICEILFNCFKFGFEDMINSFSSNNYQQNNAIWVDIANNLQNHSNSFSYYDPTDDLRLLIALHKPSNLRSEINQVKEIEKFHKESISNMHNKPDEVPLVGYHMTCLYGTKDSRICNNMSALNEINSIYGDTLFTDRSEYSFSDYLIKRLNKFDGNHIRVSLDIIEKYFLRLHDSLSMATSVKIEISPSHYNLSQDLNQTFSFTSNDLADICASKLSEYYILSEQNHPFWLANDLLNNHLVHPPVSSGLNLYSGKAGIALFLSHYSEINKNSSASNANQIKHITNLIRQELHDHFSASSIQSIEYSSLPLGICGIGGFLIAFKYLKLPELHRNLIQNLCVDSINTDCDLDFIAGACGCVGPLLSNSSQKSLDLAYSACNRFKDMQDISGAWDINPSFSKLISFAHGTSGFIAALVRCSLTLNTDEFDLTIEMAINYERKMFNKKLLTWPDLRRSYNDTVLSWCHCAPSVLLSRCCLVGTKYWDDYCETEIILGLQAIQNLPLTDVKNICCGSFGLASICSIVEIISSSLSTHGHKTALELINMNRQKIFENISSMDGYNFLFNDKDPLIETGLFTGISGIGLSLSSRSLPLLATVISGDLLKLQNLK